MTAESDESVTPKPGVCLFGTLTNCSKTRHLGNVFEFNAFVSSSTGDGWLICATRFLAEVNENSASREFVLPSMRHLVRAEPP